MKKTFSLIILIFILFFVGCTDKNSNLKDTSINSTSKPNDIISTSMDSQKRAVAYFTSWSAYERNVTLNDVDPNLLTHINFAFANLKSDGEIYIGDSWVDIEKLFSTNSETGINGHFGELIKIKQKYPNIKTLISVGGWTWSSNFSEVASTDASREKFAKSAVEFITKYGFDGIDIDWEFPVEGGNNIPHKPEDKTNYTKLLSKTREELYIQGRKDNKHYLLTIAGGPNVSFVENTELSKIINYVDFINIMAYDYHGSWDSITNHNTPLYDDKNNSSVSNTVNAYISAGVNPKDLNLGLAFYGRGWSNVTNSANNGLGQSGTAPTSKGYGQGTWEASSFDYWDLEENYINKNGYIRYFDNNAKVPYLYNGNTFISYDDEESIKAKLSFSNEKNLGGVMFWEFSGDKNKVLQKVIKDFYDSSLSSNNITNKDIEENPETNTISDNQLNGNTSSTKNEEIPSWNKDIVYAKDDIVLYDSKIFKAKWWTQNEIPNEAEEWGPWEIVKQ